MFDSDKNVQLTLRQQNLNSCVLWKGGQKKTWDQEIEQKLLIYINPALRFLRRVIVSDVTSDFEVHAAENRDPSPTTTQEQNIINN